MGLGIPPLEIKIVLNSNPLKSTMLVGRLGVRSIADYGVETDMGSEVRDGDGEVDISLLSLPAKNSPK